MSKEIMAAEVGNQAGRGYQLLEGKLLEMEASALVVSDADVFREPGRMRVAGQRSQPGLVAVHRWRNVRSWHVSRKDGTKGR